MLFGMRVVEPTAPNMDAGLDIVIVEATRVAIAIPHLEAGVGAGHQREHMPFLGIFRPCLSAH